MYIETHLSIQVVPSNAISSEVIFVIIFPVICRDKMLISLVILILKASQGSGFDSPVRPLSLLLKAALKCDDQIHSFESSF